MHKRIGIVVALFLMTAIVGCGTSASHQVSVTSTTAAKGCPAGAVSINEDGTIHCLATKKSPRNFQGNTVSERSSFSLPAHFHYWTRQYDGQPSHSVETLEVLTAGQWWSKLDNVWKNLASIDIQPSAAMGMGVDLSGGTAAGSGLEFLREASPDPAYVLFFQSPQLPLSHHEASLMAAASAAIITAYANAFPQATEWPALIVRWQGPYNQYVQLGESGSYADAALEHSGLQAPGWAVGTGSATPSAPLSWDPTNEDLSQMPSVSTKDPLYQSTNEMVHGIAPALDWMSAALYDWGRSSSLSSTHSTATENSPSSSPSSAVSPTGSPSGTPSPSQGIMNYLNVTMKDSPQGIGVSWSAQVGVSPAKATVVYSVNNGTPDTVMMENGSLVPHVTVGQTVTILSVTASSLTAQNVNELVSPVQYGANTETVSVGATINPQQFSVDIGYSKSLPMQIPSQQFADYHVMDTTTNVVGTVTSAKVVTGIVGPYSNATMGGVLQLLVTFPSNADFSSPNSVVVTTSMSVVHTQSGAPTQTDGTGLLN